MIYLQSFSLQHEVEVAVADVEVKVLEVLVEGHHLLLGERVHTPKQGSLYHLGWLCTLLRSELFKLDLQKAKFC